MLHTASLAAPGPQRQMPAPPISSPICATSQAKDARLARSARLRSGAGAQGKSKRGAAVVDIDGMLNRIGDSSGGGSSGAGPSVMEQSERREGDWEKESRLTLALEGRPPSSSCPFSLSHTLMSPAPLAGADDDAPPHAEEQDLPARVWLPDDAMLRPLKREDSDEEDRLRPLVVKQGNKQQTADVQDEVRRRSSSSLPLLVCLVLLFSPLSSFTSFLFSLTTAGEPAVKRPGACRQEEEKGHQVRPERLHRRTSRNFLGA